jgi:hypothetical protein
MVHQLLYERRSYPQIAGIDEPVTDFLAFGRESDRLIGSETLDYRSARCAGNTSGRVGSRHREGAATCQRERSRNL